MPICREHIHILKQKIKIIYGNHLNAKFIKSLLKIENDNKKNSFFWKSGILIGCKFHILITTN